MACKVYGTKIAPPRQIGAKPKDRYSGDWCKGLAGGKAPEGVWVTPNTTTLQLDLPESWQRLKGRLVGCDKKRHLEIYRGVVVLLVVAPGQVEAVAARSNSPIFRASLHCTDGHKLASNTTVNLNWFLSDRSRLAAVRAGNVVVAGLGTRDLRLQPYIKIVGTLCHPWLDQPETKLDLDANLDHARFHTTNTLALDCNTTTCWVTYRNNKGVIYYVVDDCGYFATSEQPPVPTEYSHHEIPRDDPLYGRHGLAEADTSTAAHSDEEMADQEEPALSSSKAQPPRPHAPRDPHHTSSSTSLTACPEAHPAQRTSTHSAQPTLLTSPLTRERRT
ncbi:hypothetical protein JCM1840_007240 [Sporobolomyces johnsonii]